jgi:hypothetical protein
VAPAAPEYSLLPGGEQRRAITERLAALPGGTRLASWY